MPQMELSGQESLLWLEIQAYMAFPWDERARHALIVSTIAKGVSSTSMDGQVSLPAEFLSLVVEAHSLDHQINAASDAAMQHGYSVGHTLLTLIELDEAGQEPSLGKAHHIVSAFLASARNAHKKKAASSVASLRNSWSIFRGVAHLWAAHCLFVNIMSYQDTMEFLSSDEGQRIFLATAQHMLNAATSIEIDGHPILDPETTWTIPDSVVLPTVSWTVSGLGEEQEKALASYKRRPR